MRKYRTYWWQYDPYPKISYNEAETYNAYNICRHCPDQQTDSLVFTEYQADHREVSHWKVGGQRPILVPLLRNLEGHLPSLPCSLFHSWLLNAYVVCTKPHVCNVCWNYRTTSTFVTVCAISTGASTTTKVSIISRGWRLSHTQSKTKGIAGVLS